MTTDERINELMGLHKEQLARMIAEGENQAPSASPTPADGQMTADDTAVHDAETAAIAAEVNGEPPVLTEEVPQ